MSRKRTLKPKREPDAIVVFENTLNEEKYEYQLWFNEMVLRYSTYEKNIKNEHYSKKAWYTETRKMEHWVSSTLKTKWTTIDEHGEEFFIRTDNDFGLDDFPLEEKIEKEYQNWLATKELEKHLK